MDCDGYGGTAASCSRGRGWDCVSESSGLDESMCDVAADVGFVMVR